MLALTIAVIVLLVEMSLVFAISAIAISRHAKNLTSVFTDLGIAVNGLAETAKGIVESLREMGDR